MAKNVKKIENRPIEKADKARELIIEKETALSGINDMTSKIAGLESRINEIDLELNALLGLGKERRATTGSELTNSKYNIPKGGLVKDMASVMSATEPMTMNEIIKLLNAKDKENSIRSYLTNLSCFECIKKNNPNYSKKGWICHKDMIK